MYFVVSPSVANNNVYIPSLLFFQSIYSYADKLIPKTSLERDFPEARERLHHKGLI